MTTISAPNRWLVLGALAAALLAVASKNMVVDLDLFHEMALYRQAEVEGSMPTTDAFAYTPTNESVVHHEWATGAILYVLCVSLGWGAAGLLALKYALTFGIGLGCYWYVAKNDGSLAVFAMLAAVALNVGGWMAFTNIRAQLFTLYFLVVMLLLLDIDRRGQKWWIAVWLPLVVVWGNVHGGVVSGIGLIGCYGIARTLEAWLATRSVFQSLGRIQHLLYTGIGTAILLNVSPYGWEYVPYLIRAIRMPRELIPEWNPIWALETNDALVFYVISLVIAIGGLVCFWSQPVDRDDPNRQPWWQRNLFTPLALGLTAYMAAKHYRHGSLYAVTWVCLVPPLFNSLRLQIDALWNKRARIINIVATAVILFSLGLAIRSEFWSLRIPGQKSYANESVLVYPVGPVDYLASHEFKGNLFVPFNLGAFVSWKLYPNVKVSIDSRYEVAYPHGALEENFAFYNKLGNWENTLDRYPTDGLLIPRYFKFDSEVTQLTSEVGDWKLVYQDQEFLLLVRKGLASDLGLGFQDRSKDKIVGVFP